MNHREIEDEAARLGKLCRLPAFDNADAGKLAVAFDKLRPLTRNGDKGRVYGGDPSLIHAADGTRAALGTELAHALDLQLRHDALMRGDRTLEEAASQPACPGCYMVILFNAAAELARMSGQPLTELGRTMAAAFGKLAEGGDASMESIAVLLDPA